LARPPLQAGLVRLTTCMLATAHGSGSGTNFASLAVLLTILISFGALLVAIATLVLQYTTSVFRRRMVIGMPVSARLISQSVVSPDLHVLYGDHELADPHVLEVALTYRGRGDIRVAAFEEGRPFCIDVGVRIIDLLEKIFDPAEAPVPKVDAVGTVLRVGPSLLRKGQAMTFVVLTDGPCVQLIPENPLADVKVRRETRYQARQGAREARDQSKLRWVARVLGWAMVVFLAWYLFTDPISAGRAIQDLGTSLANFLNSL
jgi:hypothetical protein